MNVKIKSIRKMKCDSKRYDIQMAKNNNFFANNVLVHNSLIPMYFYKNQWNVATRKMAEAEGPLGKFEGTFKNLILATMEQMGFSFEELDKEKFYAFELTSPLNPVVVPYDDYNLTWIGCWDKNTLEEIPIWDLPDLTAPKVELLPFTSLDEVLDYIKNLSITEGEGVVLLDGNFNRLKLKSLDYLMAFRVITSAESSPRNKIEILLSDKYDDIYGMLPDRLKVEMDDYSKKLHTFIGLVTDTYNEHKDLESQKDFALAVKDLFYSGWLFQMRKGKTIEELLKSTQRDTVLEYLEQI